MLYSNPRFFVVHGSFNDTKESDTWYMISICENNVFVRMPWKKATTS